MSSWFRMRPQYELRAPLPVEAVHARVEASLRDPRAVCAGMIEDGKVQIMARGENHFWSPELRATVEPETGGSRMVGRFGPRPAVWTMFTVIYIHLAFAAIAGAVYSMAQLTLARSPSALWAIPIALVLAVVVRLIARVGQNLGADEMDVIRAFVAEAVEDASPG